MAKKIDPQSGKRYKDALFQGVSVRVPPPSTAQYLQLKAKLSDPNERPFDFIYRDEVGNIKLHRGPDYPSVCVGILYRLDIEFISKVKKFLSLGSLFKGSQAVEVEVGYGQDGVTPTTSKHILVVLRLVSLRSFKNGQMSAKEVYKKGELISYDFWEFGLLCSQLFVPWVEPNISGQPGVVFDLNSL